jgi:glycine/D-amino acid oxidase-like deaminating enzyme
VGRYEQLRSVALAGGTGGHALGLGLVMGQGLAAWMAAWQTIPAPATSLAPQTPAAASSAVVVVLAAMAVGLLQCQQAAATPKGAS